MTRGTGKASLPRRSGPARDRSAATTIDHDAPADADVLRLEVAGYIEAMSAELQAMAKAAGIDSLGYFLGMARLEASLEIERLAPRHPGIEDTGR